MGGLSDRFPSYLGQPDGPRASGFPGRAGAVSRCLRRRAGRGIALLTIPAPIPAPISKAVHVCRSATACPQGDSPKGTTLTAGAAVRGALALPHSVGRPVSVAVTGATRQSTPRVMAVTATSSIALRAVIVVVGTFR